MSPFVPGIVSTNVAYAVDVGSNVLKYESEENGGREVCEVCEASCVSSSQH